MCVCLRLILNQVENITRPTDIDHIHSEFCDILVLKVIDMIIIIIIIIVIIIIIIIITKLSNKRHPQIDRPWQVSFSLDVDV